MSMAALVTWPLRILASRDERKPKASNVESATSDAYRRTLEALKSRGRRPKRWMGQNYMLNGEINEGIVRAAKLKQGDLVLEIGPGTGSLTEVLVGSGAFVIAVEKDEDMASLVAERFKDHPQVQLHTEDILKWHIKLHLENWIENICKGPPNKQVKVVSNLPFNITTDVLKLFLPMGDVFSHVVLLLQDEAAARFMDTKPSADEYRYMSIFVRYFSDLEYITKVDRSNFFPRPPVDGAVVSFTLKKTSDYPHVPSVKEFFTLVQSAFNGKRKMLRTSLQHLYNREDIESALQTIGVIETARPHQLTFDQFVALQNALSSKHDEV